MVDFEILDKLYTNRIKLMVVPGAMFLLAIFSVGTPFRYLLIPLIVLSILSVVFLVAYEFIFEFMYGKSKEFYSRDFGYFTASIHNDFKDWHQSQDSELSIPNCSITRFANVISTYANVSLGKDYQYSTVTSNVYKEHYQRRDVAKFFMIYYMVFDTKEACDLNNDLIREKFKGKTGGVNHFHENNIHIVFHASAEDANGKEINYKQGADWPDISRRASKTVKLK